MAAEFKLFKADLHIHTCLSPCADLDMSPKNIVQKAIEREIDIIAITDHNSSENVKAVYDAAKGTKVKVFFGMEITTKEEVHLLSYFPTLKSTKLFENFVYENLDKTENRKIIDEQVIANGKDEVLGFLEYNLFSAVKKPIETIVNKIHELKGVAIPAHIDREGFGIINQLGFFPSDINFDGVECYDRKKDSIKDILKKYSSLTSSDSHSIDEIGKRTTLLKIKKVSFGEFVKALKGIEGRKIEV